MNKIKLCISFGLIILFVFTQSCARKTNVKKYAKINPNSSVNQEITDYQIVLAEHISTESSESSICGMTDFELQSQFNLLKYIQGDLSIIEPEIKVKNCNHYYKQPFIGRKYDGLSTEYDFKWLLLLVKKNNDYFLVESELVFSLKDKRFAFCTIKSLIQKLLNSKNKYLGEYVGNPIPLNNNKSFFKESECYSVKGSYAYLDQGIILENIIDVDTQK